MTQQHSWNQVNKKALKRMKKVRKGRKNPQNRINDEGNILVYFLLKSIREKRKKE